jgi:hypothetical protein
MDEHEPKEDVLNYYGGSPNMTLPQIEKKLAECQRDIKRVEENPYRGEGFLSNLKMIIYSGSL